MQKKHGTLPREWIVDAVSAKMIEGTGLHHIQPASLDLCVDAVYRVRAVGLPAEGQSVEHLLRDVEGSLHQGPLERGVVYLVRLKERLSLPEGICGVTNPKSTTGRLDLHVRVVLDGVPRFDTIPFGYQGPMWAFVVSGTFTVIIPHGTPITQLRLYNVDTRLSETELLLSYEQHQLLFRRDGVAVPSRVALADRDGTCLLTLDTETATIGWIGDPCGPMIDLSKVDNYEAKDFFTPIRMNRKSVLLKKDAFYILSTAEFVRVPPSLSCEMLPMDFRSGEFRAHYAGFIDPGWGWGLKGEQKGRPLTLEVRPHENIIVSPGQPIAKIGFSAMAAIPGMAYDEGAQNYQQQDGPKLAKQFKRAV